MTTSDPSSSPAAGVHVMAKPAGPLCNLDCRYCFYLEKENLYPPRQRFLMSEEVLRAYVEQSIRLEPGPEVLFTWQGGEPLLRGLDFYRRAVALQRELAGGKHIRNSLQTNGVLLDADWCEFFAAHGFELGVSLDGPAEIHDAGRPDKRGQPTFARVMQGIALLRQHRVDFNILVTVSAEVARQPLAVYRFLKAERLQHVQFNPVVERRPGAGEQVRGLSFAEPGRTTSGEVTADSVSPAAYGEFLVSIFDEWVRQDVGRIYVQNFEWALGAFLGLPATVCLFAENCGKALILEHDGDLYSCDHYMYPAHRLGNIAVEGLAACAGSPAQTAFGLAKSATLPAWCRQCEYLGACRGECPKNRFATAPDGEYGLNYLCPAYKRYFRHVAPYMNAMAKLIRHGQPAARIMEALRGPLAITLS